MKIIFKGCKYLQYEGYSIPRQAISLNGETALCYARLDPDGVLQLCQFCIRGRMNDPESGITKKCCSSYEEVIHAIEVDEKELESNPRDFVPEARP